MSNKDFIPRGRSGFKDWSTRLNQNLPQHNLLDPNELRDLGQKTADLATAYDAVQAAEENLKLALSYKDSIESDHRKDIRKLLAKAKKSPNYSPAIGDALHITSNNPMPTDWNGLKPKPELFFLGQRVQIKYIKGDTEGVRIYCRRAGEQSFSPLDRNAASPFVDSRPNLNGSSAEKRDYYLVYMKDNQEIGLQSDIVSITVSM